jgi:hypothetical protein
LLETEVRFSYTHVPFCIPCAPFTKTTARCLKTTLPFLPSTGVLYHTLVTCSITLLISKKEKKGIFEMSLKKGAFFRESAKTTKFRCFFLGKILEKLVIFLDEKMKKS